MSDKLSELLARFREENAEKCYGAYYQYCASGQLGAEDAEKALVQIVSWIRDSKAALTKSYGLLMLGGLVDSGKLAPIKAAPLVAELFIEQSQKVTDFGVLSAQRRFVHFVSHFAYLAGSICEQFTDQKQDIEAIVFALVDLYLRAPSAYWCGEELLLARVVVDANMDEQKHDELFAKLMPTGAPQDADGWDATAARQWQAVRISENHKRQLVMALHAVSQKGANELPASKVATLVDAHYGAMIG